MGVATSSRGGRWTLEDMHRLPDDGNKYELVRGELFVTPPPSVEHELIGARLSRILVPYVDRNRLGHVMHPRAVVRLAGSEVEPDLMVRAAPAPGEQDWERAPLPILVVEVLSPTTRRRDLNQKKIFYLDAGVAEYWIVDPESRTITVVRRDHTSLVREDDVLTWTPLEHAEPLSARAADVFSD